GGGGGGHRGPSSAVNEPPDRAPDHVTEQFIPDNQALLYRLSGDWNPLHADPGFAQAFGFERPILHGLCTFGYAGRHVVDAFAPDGNPDFFKSIKVRFADNVFPGETLLTEMWQEGAHRVVFRCRVKERDTVVISNAAVAFFEEVPDPEPALAEPAADVPVEGPEDAFGRSFELFAALGHYVSEHPELIDEVDNVYLFELTDPDSAWTVDLKHAPGSVAEGRPDKPDCTIRVGDADFVAMSEGQTDAFKLFTQGRLKVSGNIMASQKVEFLQSVDADSPGARSAIEAAKASRAAGGSPRPTERAPREPVADALFAALAARETAGEADGVVLQFHVREPDAAFVVDRTTSPPAVRSGVVASPTTTITLRDDDLEGLERGEHSAAELYQKGRLRVDGEVWPARNLDFLQHLR
ncbi:MAG: SCP2 sterol-binding domain-containing protein, partial [Myxococcota bacterium]